MVGVEVESLLTGIAFGITGACQTGRVADFAYTCELVVPLLSGAVLSALAVLEEESVCALCTGCCQGG